MGVLQTIRETIGYPAPGDFTFDAKELKPFEPKEKHPDDPEFKTVRRLTPEEEKRYQEIQEKGGWTHEQGRAFFGTGGKRPFQKGSEGASPLEMQKTVEELTNMVKTEKEKEAEILRKEEEERKARQEMNGDEDCLGCRLVGGSAGLGLGVYSMYATLQASSKMTGTRQTVCRAGGVIMATAMGAMGIMSFTGKRPSKEERERTIKEHLAFEWARVQRSIGLKRHDELVQPQPSKSAREKPEQPNAQS